MALAAESGANGTEPAVWPVIGHDDIVDSLRRAIARDRVSHAYLLTGAEGAGKTALATAFAQALCCQAADRPDRTVPCGICLACRKIARGTHPDVQVLDLDTQRRLSDRRGGQNTTLTIDSIRQLAADAALRPMEAPRRILIVDDAESMQEVAQEALLKTLEEPPPAVLILLLADDASRLLATIQSRCQLLGLRPVPTAMIARALAAAGLDLDRAREAAALAAGRPGWALRAAQDPSLIEAQRSSIERALTWIEASTYGRLVRAVKLGDAYQKRRADVIDDVAALLAVWRDLMLVRAAVPEIASLRSAHHRLAEVSASWSLEATTRATRSVQICLADLEANVRPRLALEAMVLQWPSAPRPD
jgi:DNA polymerase-3 subunit delta'